MKGGKTRCRRKCAENKYSKGKRRFKTYFTVRNAIMYSEEVDYDVVNDSCSIFCTEGEVRTTEVDIMAHT